MTNKRKKGELAPEPEPTVPGLPIPVSELDKLRQSEVGASKKKGNIFIGTLNIIVSPLRPLLDPVRKVCYEPFVEHYEERYKKRYPKHAGKLLIFDLILLATIGALVVGGIFAWLVMPIFPEPQTVSLQALAPKQLISGESVDFIVSYRNETGEPLASAELRLRMPEGFATDDDGAEDATDAAQANGAGAGDILTVPVGLIKAYGQGDARISGRVFRPTGSKVSLAGELIYWKEGQALPERVSLWREWLIEDSILQLDLRAEDKVTRGRQSAITVAYENTGDEDVDAVIRVSLPEDFLMTGSSPAMTGRGEWRISDLHGGGRGSITVYGLLKSGGAAAAPATFTVRGYLTIDGKRLLVQELRQNIESQESGFELTLESTNPAAGRSANPGSDVEVAVRYKVNGSTAVESVKITLTPDERYIIPQIKPGVSWDETTTPSLERVEAAASGELKATFRLRDPITAEMVSPDPSPVLRIEAQAEYTVAGGSARPILVEAAPISIPISTVAGLDAGAIYYTKDGEQLGSGPLPPEVGETTKYRVFLRVSNSTSPLENAQIEATLPTDVAWTGHYSIAAGEPIAYLPDTNRILWRIGSVPAAVSSEDSKILASFEVALTPSAADVGTALTLLKSINLTAVDANTDARISASAADISTDLTLDSRAAGKGKVVK
jgi:hypothetical protein